MSKLEGQALLHEFAEPSLQEWRQEVERLLKGAPFARKMFTRTWEGITVNPLYTGADTADLPWLDSLPGQAPFVRGNRPDGYHEAPWLVAQENRRPTCEEFNRDLLHALQRGQTAANLIFDYPSRLGQDPDQAAGGSVGLRGTSVCSLADMKTALADVDLASCPIIMQAGGAALPATAYLVAMVRAGGGDVASLSGCVGCSPCAGLASLGRISTGLAAVRRESAILTRWAVDHAPQLRTLPVSETPWHDGGADLALGLALTLAEAVAALRDMEAAGLPLDVTAPRVQFNLSIGTDFFMELAKVRALRLVWSRLLTAAGVAPEYTRTFIHARTARRCLTVLDPHVNMLRATTAAMSAVLGGVDSLHVEPFDAVDRLPDEFSNRIARNVQLILAHECRLDQVTDPAGGSWYVEKLTSDLAAAVWEKFQAVMKAGGLPEALLSGWAQEQVAAAAAQRSRDFATRRQVLVGTNMYPDPAAQPRPVPAQETPDLQRDRAAAVVAQRESQAPAAHMLVLGRLAKIMDSTDDQVFEHLVAAAETGATLSELASALRHEAGPSPVVTPIPCRRDAAPFEDLRARSVALAENDPAAARVFTVCLGDFARYMPRLEFVRGFFQVGGFTVAGDAFFTTPEEAATAARQDDARIVVLVGLDETYTTQAAAVAGALSTGPEPPTIVLAGAPGENEAALRDAGVQTFIHARSDVLAVLGDLLPGKGVQS